jgi:hypothetical protein
MRWVVHDADVDSTDILLDGIEPLCPGVAFRLGNSWRSEQYRAGGGLPRLFEGTLRHVSRPMWSGLLGTERAVVRREQGKIPFGNRGHRQDWWFHVRRLGMKVGSRKGAS